MPFREAAFVVARGVEVWAVTILWSTHTGSRILPRSANLRSNNNELDNNYEG